MKIKRFSVLATLLLTACGGGGSGVVDNGDDADASRTAKSDPLAAICAEPRSGTDPYNGNQPYPDRAGTLTNEKTWLSTFMHEVYLWDDEIPAVNPSPYTAASYGSGFNALDAYFDALRTPKTTTSGKRKDQFSFTYPTAAYNDESLGGIEVGYGMRVALLAASKPREAVIAYTDPGTPAAAASIERGARILAVDGVDLVNGSDTATLNQGLYPDTVGESHTFRLRDLGSSTTRDVVLTAQQTTSQPVRTVGTLDTPSGRVGYLLFNAHIAVAERELYDAVRQLQIAGISDLVLDLRYNGGGFLDIASELGFMIAGDATNGRVFEQLQFNAHNPLGADQGYVTPFHRVSQGFDPALPRNTALPALGLRRVFVLAGSNTCSASEAIINGLRGIDVQTVLIGATTCGKPYGFFPTDNCGLSYFAIEFAGVNDKGQGDYADGMAPDCAVADDFEHALGNPAEARLAAALAYRDTGSCPIAAKSAADRPVLLRRSQPMENAWRRLHPSGFSSAP